MKYLLLCVVITAINSIWQMHRASNAHGEDWSLFAEFWGSHIITVAAIIVYCGAAIWNQSWY